MNNTVIIIPSRLAATRLPNKPLLDINGKSMIIRVLDCARNATDAPIYVACGDREIYEQVTNHGGLAVMTDPALPSGTDRVYHAYTKISKHHKFENIINLQGDMPSFSPDIITKTIELLENTDYDIVTVAAPANESDAKLDSVVKPVIGSFNEKGYAKALYFSRSQVPHGAKQYYHHIGIYGFREPALEKYVNLPKSELEERERLEQLRALENGMNIGIAIVDDAPMSVDTPYDLEIARRVCQYEEH